jgi:hypothetical protein
MKLKTLFAIIAIVNSTCPQTYYHIFTYTSLDFLQGICRMPRSTKKAPSGTFFVWHRILLLLYSTHQKVKTYHQAIFNSEMRVIKAVIPRLCVERKLPRCGVRVWAALTAMLHIKASGSYSLFYNIREPLQSKRQNVSGLFLRLCTG